MARPSKHDGAIYPRKDRQGLVDASIVTGTESAIRESTNTDDWQEAQRKLRERLQARDDKHPRGRPERRATTISRIGRTFFWRTIPSHRSAQQKTHEANERAVKHLKRQFGDRPCRRYHGRRYRALSSSATAGASSGQDRRRVIQKDRAEAGDSASGAAGASPYAECRRS